MSDNNLDQKEIDELIGKDIIDIVGLTDLPEGEKQELRGQILETVQNRVFERILNELKEKNQLDEFKNIGAEEEIEKFFKANSIDTDIIFLEEAIIYKAQMKNATDMMKLGLKAKVEA